MRTLGLLSSLALLLLTGCPPLDKDSASDSAVEIIDLDEDGIPVDDDCDDTDPDVHPGADERCNGLDDDCDGETDEDAIDAPTWYADADADGYGDADAGEDACEPPSGYVEDASDCDDDDDTINPDAEERCNGVDDDCDGEIDEEATDTETWHADEDGDGYGDPDQTAESCESPEGYVADGSDCDDQQADAHPDAEESCDGIDNDCDGEVDEGVTTTWYADNDADGYGDADDTVESCSLPTGYTDAAGDCDDGDDAVNPDAEELCNGVDDDCDGLTDDEDGTPSDAGTWYADADADGFGDAASSALACDQPSAHVQDDSDCDDADAAVNPDAEELCNGVDDDCDGLTDENDPDVADADTWYPDADGDGFGDASSGTAACSQPSGLIADGSDCDDADASVRPDTWERCDGADDDCDGSVDEDCFACTAEVPADHATIQDAIDSGASGDTICVDEGSYAENIDFSGKDLLLVGPLGASWTEIDGGGAGPVVSFQASESSAAELRGFTLTNGYATSGGGVYIYGASPSLADLVIAGNEATYGGGGIYAGFWGAPSVENTVVEDNYGAWFGGGIYGEYVDLAMDNTWIARNEAGYDAGALGLDYGSIASLGNVTMVGNYAGSGGGAIYLYLGAELDMQNSLVVGNSAGSYAGAAYLYYSGIDADNCVIAYNDGPTGAGALYLTSSSTYTYSATYSDVYGNSPYDFENISDPAGTDGNISADPLFLDTSAVDPADWDLHLDSASSLIDAGDASLFDPDGSVSDMGVFGGEQAGSFDLDGDGDPWWWQPGAYDPAYAADGWDCDDRDPGLHAAAGCQ